MLTLTATLLLLSAAPSANEKAFNDLLARAKLTYTAPANMTEAPLQQNRAMSYDWALRNADKTLEIRVAIRLPQPPPKEAPGTKTTRVPDENVFPAMLQATLLNLTNGAAGGAPKAFSPRAVNGEFNADSGFTTFLEPKAEGWNGYKNCMVYAVRKAGAAEVYVFFLFDDFPTVQYAVRDAFHLVKFK